MDERIHHPRTACGNRARCGRNADNPLLHPHHRPVARRVVATRSAGGQLAAPWPRYRRACDGPVTGLRRTCDENRGSPIQRSWRRLRGAANASRHRPQQLGSCSAILCSLSQWAPSRLVWSWKSFSLDAPPPKASTSTPCVPAGRRWGRAPCSRWWRNPFDRDVQEATDRMCRLDAPPAAHDAQASQGNPPQSRRRAGGLATMTQDCRIRDQPR